MKYFVKILFYIFILSRFCVSEDFDKLNHPDYYEMLKHISEAKGEKEALIEFTEIYKNKSPYTRLTDTTSVRILLEISKNILSALPDSSILVTNGDNDTYPFWYLQRVNDYRKDVLVINRNLFNSEEYRKFLWRSTIIKNIISLDSIISICDTIIEGKNLKNLSLLTKKLCKKYICFAEGCVYHIPEFPEDSLYDVPIIGLMYSPMELSDDSIAALNYEMLMKQNWNYIKRHPPIQSYEQYRNTRSINLPNVPIIAADVVLKSGDTLRAYKILKKFDDIMDWDPNYLIRRAFFAKSIGDNADIWIKKTKKWIETHPEHWATETVKQLLMRYEKDNN